MGTRQQTAKTFRAALYMRLSRDDEGSGESASISTQRDILRAFAQTQGIAVAGEYVDDGYSGTNFDRPDYQRMIADIEAGKINCVITKDLSRLGRNSAKTTDLLEEYFPEKNVRYISVTDGFDSLSITSGMAVATPFMLVMNEFYARDISHKIRSSLYAKMQKGDFISPFAPYGYQKDPENKNHLIVDPEAAEVVRSLFRMAADGVPPREIARTLNERHVPTPSEYRCQNRPDLKIEDYSRRREWTSVIVCKMLRNSVYLGQTEHGKTTKVSFKSKQTRVNSREDWIVVEGTHEAIISPELFEQARRRSVARRCEPNRGFTNVFSGIARCADCGRGMTTAPSRKKGSTYNLCCGAYKAYGSKECGNHFVDYDLLYEVVSQEMHSLLSLTEPERREILTRLAQEEESRQRSESGRLDDLLKKKEQRLQEVKVLIKKAFELYAIGAQSDATYQQLMAEYERERQVLEESLQALKTRLTPDHNREERYRKFFALLGEVESFERLTPDLLKKLIDRIEVEQGFYAKDEDGKKRKHQTIRIYYRFVGCLEKTPQISSSISR